MTIWRPRPRPSTAIPTLVLVAFIAAMMLFLFAISMAWKTESDRREFDAIMAPYDAERVTPAQVRAAVQGRLGEEIAMQAPRPAPQGLPVRVTFYSEEYRGRPMTYGGLFDPDGFTCAHRDRRMRGREVEFSYRGRSITLPVTDRGPWDRYPIGHPKAGQYRKEFDLSRAAFQFLEPNLGAGVITVRARVLPEG